MSGIFRFGVHGTVLFAGMLSGCSSLMYGEQYVFPTPGEPSANIRVEGAQNTSVSILNRDEEGCYVGITGLPHKGNDIDGQIKPGKELVLLYRRDFGTGICQLHLGLTPEPNATYTLVEGTWSETKNGLLPGLTREQGYCGLVVVKKLGEQENVEPGQQMMIDRGITCHKFVKRKR